MVSRATSVDDAIRLADDAWNELLEYADKGLSPDYDSMGDYLYDWYTSLPWDTKGVEVAIKYLLQKPDDDFNKIVRTLKLDMRAELQRELETKE